MSPVGHGWPRSLALSDPRRWQTVDVTSEQADGAVPRSLAAARAIVSGAAGVALLSVFLAVHGKMVAPANFYFGVVFAVWWFSPLVYYWTRVATLIGAWLLGLAYIGVSAWLLMWIYRSESSTAALGFLFLPPFLWAGMLMGVDIDRAAARWLLRGQRSGRAGSNLVTSHVRMDVRDASWWEWTLPTGAVLVCLSFFWWSVPWAMLAAVWNMASILAAITRHRRKRVTGDL